MKVKSILLALSLTIFCGNVLAGYENRLHQFTINNFSSYQLIKTYEHAYQVHNWCFPKMISSKNFSRITVEFDLGHAYDDGAEASFVVTCDKGVDQINLHTRYGKAWIDYNTQCVHAMIANGSFFDHSNEVTSTDISIY